MALDGGPPLPLFDDMDGAPTLPPIMAFMQQSLRIGDGSVQLIESAMRNFRRDCPGAGREPECICGAFHSDGLGSTIEVRDGSGGHLVVVGPHGRADYQLEPIADGIGKPFRSARSRLSAKS